MSNATRLVQCASVDCARTFQTRSLHRIQYCPTCRERRKRDNRLLYEQLQEEIAAQQSFDRDTSLNKKLDEAEFSVLHDNGPKELAFRPGARLTSTELYYMLKFESIAVNSVVVHTQTGCRHRVLRGRQGKLVLDPPYDPIIQLFAENK
jgi:hypothetical protein